MRWRPRLSLRGLMLIVALVAAGMAVYSARAYGGRREYLLKRAEAYAGRSRENTALAVEAKQKAQAHLRISREAEGEVSEKHRRWADDELLRASLYKRIAEFDAAMETRYRVAAERPWDSPPPEESDPARPGPP